MSQTAITLAFEEWKARQAATGEAVLLDEFVFASVPGLDPAAPVDRNETLPPAGQIVHRQAVTRKGVVNDNAVVHSVVLGTDVGDFAFNWIGLINKATGTLAMVVHAPEQQKLKTKEGQQGNVLTRSFLMEYNGAQAETGINTPAETWQIDFTARMAGMDERQRVENIDIYGAAAFFGDGWLVNKTGNQFFVTKGAGYVGGLRAELAANKNITVTTKPVKVWLDVCWTGSLTSVWNVQHKITVAANLADYELNGVKHYVFALASIDANGEITDLRPKGTLNEQEASDALKKHEQSRNHPDATTLAKGFTQLSNATDSDSEAMAATPKAIKAVNDDLGNVKKALGSASGKDVVTSMTDTTVGRVPVVGWMGLSKAIFIPKNTDLAAFLSTAPGAFYHCDSASGYTNAPPSFGGNWFDIYMTIHEVTGYRTLIAVSGAGQLATAAISNSAFSAWQEIGFAKHYLPLSGGVMTGEITGKYTGGKGWGDQYVSRAPFYDSVATTTTTSEYWPSIKQKFTISGAASYSYVWSMGALVNATSTPAITLQSKGSAGHEQKWTFDISTGQFIPASYSNFDARYMQNVRVGAIGTMTIQKNIWAEAPVGSFMTGWYFEGDNPGGDSVHYRPIQIYINGGWRTITA